MSDDNRKLRGRAPLTVVRSSSGPSQHVYFSQILDPRAVDPDDLERLVEENFLEWVVPGDAGWKLAEDSLSGDAGDPVTVSQPTMADPEHDPGLVNATAQRAASDTADRDKSDADSRWAAAEAKLPKGQKPDGRAGEDTWRVYAVRQGMDRGEVEKASKADLMAALNKQ